MNKKPMRILALLAVICMILCSCRNDVSKDTEDTRDNFTGSPTFEATTPEHNVTETNDPTTEPPATEPPATEPSAPGDDWSGGEF